MSKLPNVNAAASGINNDFDKIKSCSRIMAAEFTRKQKAYEIKNTTRRSSGVVDPLRIARYKTTDDVFKTFKLRPNGKSHGVYLILDGSGSIRAMLESIVGQALLVSLFCKTLKIPFRVVMFNDCHNTCSGSHSKNKDVARGDGDIVSGGLSDSYGDRIRINEIFSSNMTLGQIQMVYNGFRLSRIPRDYGAFDSYFGDNYWKIIFSNVFNLGGTPLYKSLTHLVSDVHNFADQNKVQNMNLLTITDGGDANGAAWHSKTTHIIHPKTKARIKVRSSPHVTINEMFKQSRVKHHALFIERALSHAEHDAVTYFGANKDSKVKTDGVTKFTKNSLGFHSVFAMSTSDSNRQTLAKLIAAEFARDYDF